MAELRRRPTRYNAVVASAAVMKARPPALLRQSPAQDWHNDAWKFYDAIGEFRFGIGWIANGVSRVNLVGAIRPDQGGEEPAPLKGGEGLADIDKVTADLVASIAGNQTGQAQMLARLATLLSVAGIGWVLIETTPGAGRRMNESWKWSVWANEELRAQAGAWEVDDPETGWRKLAGAHVLVKVWRGHPRHTGHPDSAAKAALPVLRQIALLDDHVLATAQSRLAGAGLLIVPTELSYVPLAQQPVAPGMPDEGVINATSTDFEDVLIDAMTVPIGDRASAAAVVPLVIKVPGEYVDKVQHITFWSEFSEVIVELREAAIKRLALALDMPPEIVTGVSGMNHWGAWRVQEEAITLHIAPLAEIICDALTIGFLHPALKAMRFPEADVEKRMVFFDVTDLTVRPDKSKDTAAAYDRIEVAAQAYRREIGLAETDKPSDDEYQRRVLLRTLERAPQFAADILPALGINVTITADSNAQNPLNPTETEPVPTIGEPPDTQDEPIAASALFEACDAIVFRALERAGNRLRTEAARSKPGGSAVVACADPTVLHAEMPDLAWEHVDALLAGAWERVPVVAVRHGLDPGRLTRTLDNFTRGLFVAGATYEPNELASALASTAGATP